MIKKSYDVEICPYCKSADIHYGSIEIENCLLGVCVYYPATCENCGKEFKEYYTLDFDCVEYEGD
jgi:predicted Zn-ribbon and HTH transcriptional regulator